MISSSHQQKILIVDDELGIVDSLKTFLEISGFDNICEATNGDDAFQIIHNEEISLIISDVKMPGLDGIGFITKAHREFPDTPIFLMITNPSEVSPEEAKKLGAKYLLMKPLDLELFLHQVQNVLHH